MQIDFPIFAELEIAIGSRWHTISFFNKRKLLWLNKAILLSKTRRANRSPHTIEAQKMKQLIDYAETICKEANVDGVIILAVDYHEEKFIIDCYGITRESYIEMDKLANKIWKLANYGAK